MKPILPMDPTGWFQVAWSHEVAVGQVRRMTYFGRDLIAWRATSGGVTVMDAYCEHLGAHLGYGATVVEDRIRCPFHGWEWNDQGRNVCIPYEERPNIGKKIRTMPVVELNESIYVWHDVEGREPFFEVPDIFDFGDGADAADYYPLCEHARLHEEGLELHPQYVMENGVDFAHFKYVHQTPIVPKFTRQDFDDPISFVDFTITFDESDTGGKIEDINSGVQAINCGLGLAVTKSWGMIDNRTATAVTPVDDATCDIRFTVWIGRKPGDDREHSESADRHARGVIEQFENDVAIWSHQKYASPAALSRGEYPGFTALRKWAEQFYPDNTGAVSPHTTGASAITETAHPATARSLA
ncbi:Rieske 2Fe-2S domain-containing protein [soil metagenome]